MSKYVLVLVVLCISGLAFSQALEFSSFVSITESSNICDYWGFDADHMFDGSGLVDIGGPYPGHVHDNGSSTMAMWENRDWNGWNAPYCVYQTNDHPFWPGDLGTTNSNFLGDGIVVETNWDRDNPNRQNTDTQTMYGHSNYVDGYEYNCSMSWVMVEVDDVYSFVDMNIWNFNEWNDQQRGWRDVDIHYSIDGLNWNLHTMDLWNAMPTPGGYNPPSDIGVALGFDAKYIVFTCYDEQTMDNSGGDYNGVAEVQLNVPEPTTIGLLTLGGLLLRRKRS